MKLNQKGYMLVEIILASVLAISIAFYLLNLTYDFKNKSEDIYQDIVYTTDKIAITKNIMNDLDKIRSGNMSCWEENTENIKSNICEFVVVKKENNFKENRRLQITKEKSLGKTTVYYGKWTGTSFEKTDVSYYEKNFQKTLIVGEIKKNEVTEDSKYLTLTIPIQSLYDDKNYDIKLIINLLDDISPASYKIIYHSNGYYYYDNNLNNKMTLIAVTNSEKIEREGFYGEETKLENNPFSFTGCKVHFNDEFIVHAAELCEIADDGTLFNCIKEGEDIIYEAKIDEVKKQSTTFLGWSKTENGNTLDTDTITQVEKLENDELHLYARWKLDPITLPSPQVIEGATFNGWWTNHGSGTLHSIGITEGEYNPHYNPDNPYTCDPNEEIRLIADYKYE